MFKKLRQKIEESDTVKKANDSLLGKYLSPPGQQADSTSLGSESPISSSASSVPHHQHPGGRSRSRQSSIGSAVSEAASSAATPAAGAGESVLLTSAAATASPLESLSRQELLQRLTHAQSLARRYKVRLFEADNRLRECGAMPKLAARDRLIEALRLQSSLLSESRPVPDELLAEIRQAESEVAEVAHVDLDGQKKTNGDNLTAADGGDCEETAAGKQAQMMQTLQAEAKQLRELLAVKTAELKEQQKQLAQTATSTGNAGEAAAALELRLREAEARLTAAEQRHRDERAIAAEEAAACKRRLKQQLAELQQQLASREREASLKDSTGATRESEIRTLKERLDSRLASEKRLRYELKSRGAEASRLADELRISRQEAENLGRECREQRRQLDAGLTGQLEQLESQQADRLKAAAREFQDRLDAKEREFQAKFQEAVDRFQEAESRARAAHRLETDELLQGLEAREVAEGRLKRRLDAAEAERDAAVAELTACQSAAVDDVERLSADVAEAETGRLAAEATVAELRAQLAAAATTDEADGGFRDRGREAIRSAASDAAASSTASNSAVLLSSLSEQVEQVRVAAVEDRHAGDSVSLEDYEAVKMYAADLQKQLMSVSSELAELRTCAPQQPPPPPPPPPAPRQHNHQDSQFGVFTELPEVEYLRNVLYKYMLGEKTQTLARVICTVLKFTDYQIQQIMDHEGKRAATWLVAP